MKDFYELIDSENDANFRNLDLLMKDLDSLSSLDLEDMYFDSDEY